eukprot:353465-Chlamydomonas_euryale.AAC.10
MADGGRCWRAPLTRRWRRGRRGLARGHAVLCAVQAHAAGRRRVGAVRRAASALGVATVNGLRGRRCAARRVPRGLLVRDVGGGRRAPRPACQGGGRCGRPGRRAARKRVSLATVLTAALPPRAQRTGRQAQEARRVVAAGGASLCAGGPPPPPALDASASADFTVMIAPQAARPDAVKSLWPVQPWGRAAEAALLSLSVESTPPPGCAKSYTFVSHRAAAVARRSPKHAKPRGSRLAWDATCVGVGRYMRWRGTPHASAWDATRVGVGRHMRWCGTPHALAWDATRVGMGHPNALAWDAHTPPARMAHCHALAAPGGLCLTQQLCGFRFHSVYLSSGVAAGSAAPSNIVDVGLSPCPCLRRLAGMPIASVARPLYLWHARWTCGMPIAPVDAHCICGNHHRRLV